MHVNGIIAFFITRNVNFLHLLQQTLRHSKASSMDALHSTTRRLLIHHQLSMKTDEDERDDEISEPTQITRTDERKEIHTDETAKELRTPLSVAASSHASSWRFSVETQEQLVRSSKQARTAKKGVEKLQDVSNLFH